MSILVIGLAIFFGIHFVPSLPGLKNSLKSRFGEKGYAGLFSLVALAGLGLIIWGYATTEWATVYDPPVWGRIVTMMLVAPAFVCLAAANMKGRIKKALKHPMLVGVGLWGTGHLFANGDAASVVLFASFVVFSVVDVALANAQGRVAVFEANPKHDVRAVLGGIGVYVVFLFLHPFVIGVEVI